MTVVKTALAIRDWPKDDQPDEKLKRWGVQNLSDAELLALLLRTGNGSLGMNILDVARQFLVQCGGLHALSGREFRELSQIAGIGQTKAMQILCAVELSKRIQTPKIEEVAFNSSAEVANYFMPRLRDLKKEIFIVILLDARNKLIKVETVSEGSLTASIVHPREVFKPAILESAASVIFIHNHPSGDPTPSQDDLKVTNQLVEVGRLMDIRVLDHVIVGSRNFTSLAGKGLM